MSFKGENINGFHVDERIPDPKRMTEGYEKSVAVMKDIRELKESEVFCPYFHEKVQKINNVSINSQVFTLSFQCSLTLYLGRNRRAWNF